MATILHWAQLRNILSHSTNEAVSLQTAHDNYYYYYEEDYWRIEEAYNIMVSQKQYPNESLMI